MEVILLDKIPNLGNFGEQVNVKAGYARNFLIPQGKAVLATKRNIQYFKARHAELQNKLIEDLSIAKFKAEKIKSLVTVTIRSKAGEEGKLFGSIGSRDIARAVTAAIGVEISKKEVRLTNGILRTIGKHEVGFQFHSEVFTTLVIHVLAE